MTKVNELFPDAPDSIGGIEIKKININKALRQMKIQLESDVGDSEKNELKEIFVKKYKLTDVLIEGGEPVSVPLSEAEAANKKIEEAIIKKFEEIRKNSGPSEVILGRKIKGKYVPIAEATPDAGRVNTAGEIFDIEYRQRRDGAWIVIVDITDRKNSITVKLYCDVPLRGDKGNGYAASEPNAMKSRIEQRLKKGIRIGVRGDVKNDKYSGDYVLDAYDINELEPFKVKEDNEEEKRVELHLHTKMSAMDGVSSAEDLVKRAAKWGHKAIAITDHGVVQSFPEAAKAASGSGIKVIYGVEGYVVDDGTKIVYNEKDYSMSDSFIVFDLETTGLLLDKCYITEIGAIKIVGGEVCDSFSTFVHPPVSIPQKIVELTGITDAMVANAPEEEEAVGEFLKFCEGSVLVAHNAGFDTGFIRNAMQRMGKKFDFTYIDTLELSRKLNPELKSHKLNIIAKYLKIKLENHHRAVDDALCTAYIFEKFIKMLADREVYNVNRINSCFGDSIDVKGAKAYHIIILAKNMQGLENLYRLISDSHLKYFYRTPRMPKSIINKYREGLIIGSACEAGELYRAILEGKSEEEIEQLASFYDYFEVQPLGNNEFMLREGTVSTIEDLQDINKKIIALGDKMGKMTVATGDVHFLDPDDEVYRRVLMAGKGFADADLQAPLYFRTTREMLDEFSYLDEETARRIVIENPSKIADEVESIHPVKDGTYNPSIEGCEQDMTDKSWARAREIYGDDLPKIVSDRIEKELNPIVNNGYAVMYTIAQKLVSKSNSDGYLVGSRGSVGSSFIAYLYGITEVNSLPAHYVCPNCKKSEFIMDGSGISGCDLPDKDCPDCGTKYRKDGHDIPFETFLGFKGDKVPDIDLNFSGEYQNKAQKYVEELFGEGYVFKAGTIGTIADKTAYGYAKKYFAERGMVVHNAELKRISIGCTGVKRTTGQHPGGVIVCPKGLDIHMFTPVQHPADDTESDVVTTHFDYHSIHDNLLKLDILGHDDPTVIRMLEDITGTDAKQVPLDDKETLSLFLNTDALSVTSEQIGSETGTFGVPEFGTQFVRQMLMDTKPTTFSELLRISGLSHGTDVWLNNAQDYIRSGDIVLKEAICTRDDIMIYLIHMNLDPSHAFKIMEKVRKGKGLTPEDEAEMKEHDVPQWYIDSCNKIKYMFPKAHAVAYVMMAFRVAYYKVHMPLAYYSAYFSIRAEGAFDAEMMCMGLERCENELKSIMAIPKPTATENEIRTTLELVREMYARGFEFLPVDIYKSHAKNFYPVDGKILPPLSALPGVSVAQGESIAAEREKAPFSSIEDFHTRTKLPQGSIDVLQRNGCFEGMRESSQLTIFDF